MKVGTFVGGRFVFSAAPAEAGGSPLRRTPWDTAKVYHILSGAKACFGMDGCACGRGTDAVLVRCGRAVCGSFRELHPAHGRAVSCFRVCLLRCAALRVWRSLPPVPRFSSALWHYPQMPTGGAGVIFGYSLMGRLYQVFVLCAYTQRGACSLLVHLHLNRDDPCPCRNSRHLGASFPSALRQSVLSIEVLCFWLISLIGRKICANLITV